MVERTDFQAAEDAAADVRLRALFAEAGRPPMADERFTAAVMVGVRRDAGRQRQQRLAIGVGLLSVGGALLAPHLGAGAFDVWTSLQSTAMQIPFVGAQGATVALLALAAAAGWAVAERA